MRLIYLSIASPGKYYDFMYTLTSAQSRVYNYTFYYVYRVPDPKIYTTSNSIVFENMVINESRIYTQGTDDIYNGCVAKTIDALKYIDSTHEYDYVVRTNCGTYYNHRNMIVELSKINITSAILYGLHAGDMAYGACLVFNRSAVQQLVEKGLHTREYLLNRVDDLALTSISRELNFTCLPRNSAMMYDSIHEFTGIGHLGLVKSLDPGWLMYKQKTCVDEWRNVSDIWRYLQFVKEYDNPVYNILHIPNDDNDYYYVGTPSELANAFFRETEFLYNFGRMTHFDYNLSHCMESLQYYTQAQLRQMILWILKCYRPPTSKESRYLHIISDYCKDTKSIHAELFHYTFHDLWRYVNPLGIFS